MNVILLGELRGKGGEGDVVDVAQGYAENYLFPNRLALPATPGNIKQLEERRHNIEVREAKRVADAGPPRRRSRAGSSPSRRAWARRTSSSALSPPR